jgi:hypothetical protein
MNEAAADHLALTRGHLQRRQGQARLQVILHGRADHLAV